MKQTRVPFPVPSAQLGIALTTQYTCPANTEAEVRMCRALNTTAAIRTITIHIVRSGDVAGAKNMVVDGKNIPTHDTVNFVNEMVGQVLNAGDTIRALSDAGAAVSLSGAVIESTPS